MNGKPWIHSPRVDSVFILAPAFLVSLIPWFLPQAWVQAKELSPWTWVALVLAIDVAHVYGTIFRSWLDRTERESLNSILWIVLLACWAGGAALYSWGPEKFWRVLAYLAVFHFIRQQFGFLRLYSRFEIGAPLWWRRMDAIFIYSATGFPLLFWHLHGDREFNWFTSGDFALIDSLPELPRLILLACGANFLALATLGMIVREFSSRKVTGAFNWPRIAIAAGTLLSWNVGIVLFNSDLVFTMTNVVAHGIPYMALTWGYSFKKPIDLARGRRAWQYAAIFIVIIVAAAYLEELFWDNLIWAEHTQVFPRLLETITEPATLAWLVPLLALPQSSHYVLDGFIWRLRKMAKS
ncbi:MAG: hypothetical protein ACXWQE_14140 [Bdellovibrionales bacterium]